MGKKGSKKTWYEYYISMHLGFCHGPVDAITGIYVNEKEAWKGELYDNTELDIHLPDLFGGDEREGGVSGKIQVMLGGLTQKLFETFAKRLGLTPDTAPGFRRKATLAFLGRKLNEGFMVAANYPNVPPIWARYRRSSRTLVSPYAVIVNEHGYHDSNPSHIIHESIVDKDFGMGGDVSMLDNASFLRAAETLFNEKFGLSLNWTRQSTIEAFIQEIIDHIQAVFFFHPQTGLGTLRLLRNDYDPNNLIEIGPGDAVLETFRRKLWGETVNEITISWTDPETEETATLTYHDPANIAMQGEVVSENRNYYGIRSAALASFVGARDIVSAATPLATATIRVNRRRWKLVPGDVIRFSWPKYNVERIIMRVMEVDYGKPDDAKMRIVLMEDVWGMGYASFLTPPTTEWKPPEIDPDSEKLASIDSIFMAVPYPLIVQSVGEELASDDHYPEVIIAALVTPKDDQGDFRSYVLNEPDALPDGSEEWISNGEKVLTGKTTLTEAIRPAAESQIIIDMENHLGQTQPVVGGIALLGGNDESEGYARREFVTELVMFLEDLGGNTWRVARGVLDTIPRSWGSGTPIRFIDDDFDSVDTTPEPADTQVRYKLQPRTSRGLRDLNKCAEWRTNRPARPYMPFRPANVTLNGTMFEDLDFTENYNPRDWSIALAWSNRNRKMEDSVFRRWNEGSVVMEDGQTVEIAFWWAEPGSSGPAAERERRIRNLTNTNFVVDVFETGREEYLPMKFVSKRDELESLQGIQQSARLYRKGFGSDWDYFYGGWDEDFNIGEPVVGE